MTVGALILHSYTRDVRTTLCLDLLVVCYFSAWSRRGLLMYFPSPFWIRFCYSFPTVYMWDGDADDCTVYRTHFTCRYIVFVCIACMPRLCNDVLPAAGAWWRQQAPPGTSGRAARMHCTFVPIIACKSYPVPGPGASGLQVWPKINLSGWKCGDSLFC